MNEGVFKKNLDLTFFFIRKILDVTETDKKWTDNQDEPLEKLKNRVHQRYLNQANKLFQLEV